MATDTALTVYGDPLDPRGWGAEPALRCLRTALPEATWTFRPTVLVTDWETYDGPEFPGGRSAAAAVCSRVSEESGMPIDEFLWFEDAPTTSEPACRGVAAAVQQGETAGRRFRRACREATFVRRTNLDTEAAVVDLAEGVPGVDADGLADALGAGVSLPAVGDACDVTGVEAAGDRPALPTVVVDGPEGERGVSGQFDFEQLAHAVRAATGDAPERPGLDVAEAVDRHSAEGWLAVAEVTALTGLAYDEAVAAARDLDAVVEREFASESFFRASEYVADGEDGGEATATESAADPDE